MKFGLVEVAMRDHDNGEATVCYKILLLNFHKILKFGLVEIAMKDQDNEEAMVCYKILLSCLAWSIGCDYIYHPCELAFGE